MKYVMIALFMLGCAASEPLDMESFADTGPDHETTCFDECAGWHTTADALSCLELCFEGRRDK